jgi:hypothetical protein
MNVWMDGLIEISKSYTIARGDVWRRRRGHAVDAANALPEGDRVVEVEVGERREAEAGPERDARRTLVRAVWRASGGWQRQVLTAMLACAAERRDGAPLCLF